MNSATPLVSVVIPTHGTRFLGEAVATVLDQTHPRLEVLLVVNGNPELPDLPRDERIRIIPFDGAPHLGAIRRYGFREARGDILVSFDHDDLLAPNALMRLREALEGSDASMAYSNWAEFREADGEPVVYKEYWGWRSRPGHVRGRAVTELVAFEASPASLSHAWFAPQHALAWTRPGYEQAGGFDPLLDYCENQDLIIRTYLTGKMARIDECLYLRRHHDDAAGSGNEGRTQELSGWMYSRWIEALVARWASLNGLACLDLGGAHHGAPGWVTLEVNGRPAPADLRKRWPWPDSSIGTFRAHDLLHLLPDKLHTLSEIHRCLVPGGWLLSRTPAATGEAAYQDPFTASLWSLRSFDFITRREIAGKYGNETIRFRTQRLEEGPADNGRTGKSGCLIFDAQAIKGDYEGPGPHDI